jgi:hypothetical protein
MALHALGDDRRSHGQGIAERRDRRNERVVSSVPNDSIVWDVVPDGQTKAFVFVQALNDPNAPTISTGTRTGQPCYLSGHSEELAQLLLLSRETAASSDGGVASQREFA